MDIDARVIDVTPEQAQVWLKANTRNRTISPRTVAQYARDMAAGAWDLNGEAIKISTDGVLLDGQHRLDAVVEAGVTVPMLVITGLPAETQNTMDSGRRRSATDSLVLDGVTNAAVVAGIARRAWQWERGNKRFNNTATPSTTEIRETLVKYPSIARSAEMAVRTNNAFRAVKVSVAGTLHHILNQRNPNLTALFFAQLQTGAELTAGHPVLALRDRYTLDKVTNKRNPFHPDLGIGIRAWNALSANRTLDRIVQPADAPIPDPA